jgi:hypothetical protein
MITEDHAGEMMQEATGVAVNVRTSAVGLAQAERAELAASAVGAVISAENASLKTSAAAIVAAGNNLSLSVGGAQLIGAGNTIDIKQGGAQVIAAGNTVQLHQAGGGVIISPNVSVNDGFVGVMLAAMSHLEGDVRVLLSTRQAIAFGIAVGLTVVIANRLLDRLPARTRRSDR